MTITKDSHARNDAVRFAAQSAGMDDWVNPADVFFVWKIEEGLESSYPLSAKEKSISFYAG